MPRFIVDLWLDGFESEDDMTEACREFITEQLGFAASVVNVRLLDEPASAKEGEKDGSA